MISLINDLEIIFVLIFLYYWDIFNDRECYGHHGNRIVLFK
jgi:hypothetical protein